MTSGSDDVERYDDCGGERASEHRIQDQEKPLPVSRTGLILRMTEPSSHSNLK